MSRPLRIALCCQQDGGRTYPLPAYRFWADYFRNASAEAGHQILESAHCDWARGLLPLSTREREAWKSATWSAYVDWLRREHTRQPIDFVLSYLFPDQIEPTALARIRELGIPSVNFFCDNVREFRSVPSPFAAFDLHWVPEWKAVKMYQQAQLPHVHLPMPCWVPQQYRTPPARETLPVTFVGTRDEQRQVLFAAAINAGLKVTLRGTGWIPSASAPCPPPTSRNPLELAARQVDFARRNGWSALWRRHMEQRPTIPLDFAQHADAAPAGDAYWDALRESTVCLGVSRYPSFRFPFTAPDTYSRLRDIEAPMVGACYLTEWTEGLDELYELGAEIEVYRSATELAEKAQILSGDPKRRARMRHRAQSRALERHSIARSIETIATRLGR